MIQRALVQVLSALLLVLAVLSTTSPILTQHVAQIPPSLSATTHRNLKCLNLPNFPSHESVIFWYQPLYMQQRAESIRHGDKQWHTNPDLFLVTVNCSSL